MHGALMFIFTAVALKKFIQEDPRCLSFESQDQSLVQKISLSSSNEEFSLHLKNTDCDDIFYVQMKKGYLRFFEYSLSKPLKNEHILSEKNLIRFPVLKMNNIDKDVSNTLRYQEIYQAVHGAYAKAGFLIESYKYEPLTYKKMVKNLELMFAAFTVARSTLERDDIRWVQSYIKKMEKV